MHQRLQTCLAELEERRDSYLGYPVARDFSFSELADFLDVPLNNLGDPFSDSTWQMATRELEREVLELAAGWMRAPTGEWWGYVCNGGSEGNLYGLYLARELFPDAVAYFSQATHYSVSKNLHLLNMRHIMIRADEHGEMDYEDLRESIRINRDKPVIIFANIGTTMTEARDDLTRIRAILDELAVSQRYIHADAAFIGLAAPFIEPRPACDFEDGADSISISGHKFIGCPIPCGIVLARKHYVDRIARSIAYIGSLDTTISGSRNGLTPLLLWYRLKTLGREGMRQRVEQALGVADWTEQHLREAGIPVWRNEQAFTLVFPRPADTIVERFQLASEGQWSHLICVPGVTRDMIQALVSSMREDAEQ
ncbi:histidine decarboxylase [Gammaproteobacteria bacterium AB-CW1]|uniref:Histidine decarboxylase n=1 Tax=Natronospira elongata TaxID=3110268 RepID=A0AAP6MM27_9GAMM|nr:histidine decarboxylase [Gammaproteobacteria bacterium AB-CW1]